MLQIFKTGCLILKFIVTVQRFLSRCWELLLLLLFSHPVVSDSLPLNRLQHARLPCPLPSPKVFPSSCPSHWWYHPAISSSDTLFSFCPQSFPGSGTFPMRRIQNYKVNISLKIFFSFILWLSGKMYRKLHMDFQSEDCTWPIHSKQWVGIHYCHF